MRKLLLVIDYQNDFVDGSLGFEGAEKLEPIIIERIDEYEKHNGEVIFTLDTHQDDYLETVEGKNLPIPHCIEGTDGHEIYGAVRPYSRHHFRIYKNTFGSKDLVEYLTYNQFDYVELVGLVANICVLSNAILVKSVLPNAEIVVNSKACDSNDKEMMEKGYDILRNLHIKVI